MEEFRKEEVLHRGGPSSATRSCAGHPERSMQGYLPRALGAQEGSRARAPPPSPCAKRRAPGHAHIREHALGMRPTTRPYTQSQAPEPQATLAFTSMPLGCARPGRSQKNARAKPQRMRLASSKRSGSRALHPSTWPEWEHRMLSMPSRHLKSKRSSRGNRARAPPPRIQTCTCTKSAPKRIRPCIVERATNSNMQAAPKRIRSCIRRVRVARLEST